MRLKRAAVDCLTASRMGNILYPCRVYSKIAVQESGSNSAATPDAAGTAVHARDPVCGMSVNPLTAQHHFEHAGTHYHFCCAGCRAKFAADPTRYLAPAKRVTTLSAALL